MFKKQENILALNVTSVLSNDPSDRDIRRMLLGEGHWPFEPIFLEAVHALLWLASCTTGHCMQQHLGLLSNLRYTKLKYYFVLPVSSFSKQGWQNVSVC